MIVETMKYEDLCRDYDRVHDIYFDRIKNKLARKGQETNKIKRYVRKRGKPENLVFTYKYKVDLSTTFYALVIVPDYNCLSKQGPIINTFVTYRNSHGLNAIFRGGALDNEYVIAYDHFFRRFMERSLKQEMPIENAICQFIANNSNFSLVLCPSKKYPYNIMGTTNDVVVFAELVAPKVTLMKTCITRDMLYDDQKYPAEVLDINVELLAEFREYILQRMMNDPSGQFKYYDFR